MRRPLARLAGLLGAVSLSAGCVTSRPPSAVPRPPTPFVSVDPSGRHLIAHGKPEALVGINFWYGPNLALSDPARLERELDRLQARGLTTLRVMALSEGPDGAPWRLTPTLEPELGQIRPEALEGLDRLLVAVSRRSMRVILVLGNFWFWSGGVPQRVAWVRGGPIPYPDAPGGSWNAIQDYTAQFWSESRALEWWRYSVITLVNRVPPGGIAYRDNPVIAAWELMNEPRGRRNSAAMRRELHELASVIHRYDPNHLVTTGSEGSTANPADAGVDFERDHEHPAIDFATLHIWPQNWSWFDPQRPESYAAAEAQAIEHLESHLARAARLHKPLLFEEFGLARDGGSFEPSAPATLRNRFIRALTDRLVDHATRGAPVAGVLPWAWSGEGRPRRPGQPWHAGDPWVGDPPHEPAGWYGIYDTDADALATLDQAGTRLREVIGRR